MLTRRQLHQWADDSCRRRLEFDQVPVGLCAHIGMDPAMSTGEPGPLRFERDGSIAKLTLNRPAVGNAIDVPMARALMEAAIECDEDDSIRCVLLSGMGRL